MISQRIACSLCTRPLKAGRIFECQHILCGECDTPKTEGCSLCLNPANTEPTDIKCLDWSDAKKHQTPPKLFQSRHDQQNVSTSHRPTELTRSRYTSLFCQKHQEPLAFYHSQFKLLMCATCLYNMKGQHSVYSSIRGTSGVLPLKNAVEHMKTELKKDYADLTNYSSRVESSLRACRHSKSIIEGNIQSLLNEVATVCDSMARAIKKRQAELKASIEQFLQEKLAAYASSDRQLSKYREYLKEFRTSASAVRNSERVEDVAYMFSSSRELMQMLSGLKLESEAFSMSDLNMIRYDAPAFEQAVGKCLSLLPGGDLFGLSSPQKHVPRNGSAKQRQRKSLDGRNRSVSYLNLLKMREHCK